MASPALLARHGAPALPADLAAWPRLALGLPNQPHSWLLTGPQGAQATVPLAPRMVTTDMLALRSAAVAGVGVVQLPSMMVRGQLADGTLVRLLPEWAPCRELIHAVFPSRRGLLSSVRTLVDFLAERFAALQEG
ncbi:LysR substrate-binding domain protein [Bordetella pertussis STO1-CNMC-0004]|nr:LysR substrate-binding domain protein [Bordetella pertussis STO1-CNMC-0004]